MMNNAVEITGLTVRRGRTTVLDGLDLTLPGGEIIGLLGPSGSGKSTLLRSIVGVQRVRSGEVAVLGDRAGSRALRRRVGYMTQQPAIYDDLTVRQNVAYFRRVLGAPASEIDRVIARTDLGDVSSRLAHDLSGGQANRVSLAIALIGSPELLVLDEPTVGLDPVLRADLWALFRSLADEGTTLIVSSHVMDEARRCDRIVLMREGAVLADTTPEELLRTTGTDDAEDAFLRIIADERDAGDRGAPTAAEHRRGARPRDVEEGGAAADAASGTGSRWPGSPGGAAAPHADGTRPEDGAPEDGRPDADRPDAGPADANPADAGPPGRPAPGPEIAGQPTGHGRHAGPPRDGGAS